MMTDGDVSARAADDSIDRASLDSNLAGQTAIVALLEAQALVPPRSPAARLFGMTPLSSETHAMYRGVVGEIEVGEALDHIGPEWVVLHALPVEAGAADIDHLVIGPAGVFVVATKNHSGLNVWASQRTFIAGGVRHPHIRNMEYEMGRAERMLTAAAGHGVEVSGILAVVAAKSLVVREKHRDVAVLQSSNLVPWLLKHRRVIDAVEVTRVGQAAALASTWYEAGNEPAQPQRDRESFELLRARVRAAWHTQLAWAIGLSIVAVGAFGWITSSILLTALNSFGS